MISETFFSNHYASVWRSLTPAMEDFVRRMNMKGYEREWTPIPPVSIASHRGAINEAGFRAFCDVAELANDPASDALPEAVRRGFDTAHRFIYGELAPELGFYPKDPELAEASRIARRLFEFFKRNHPRQSLTLNPEFSGNGIMSRCRGDVFVGESGSLYEVKSGDRNFRSVDYRQLCIYGALYFAEHGVPVNSIGLLNPRRGVTVIVSVEDFSTQISGQSAVSLFQSIVECFSGSLISN